MLIFSKQSLAFIAEPKTGTTAIDAALQSSADIQFMKRLKHMTARRFHWQVAPFLARHFDLRPDRFALMRDPEEQARSWYRYRMRERRNGGATDTDHTSTEGMSFNEFILAVLSENPPPYAAIGTQSNMLTSAKGEPLVHHLFLYEKPNQFGTFLNDRFGREIMLDQRNVSPPVEADLDPDIRARLRNARAHDFDLYARLQDADGHLITTIG